jgi:glucose-1-phosphate adenylyltransferase
MDRDLVLGGWRAGRVSVNVFEYDGVAQYNESELEYYNHTLALLNKEVRADLFGRCHPVYTKVRDRVPCYYGEDSEIENCLIADGCMLEGEVEDSVLFRQVTIAPGAKVENCIVMNDCVIGEGAKLKYVILDKDVTVTPGANVCGTKEHPVVIKKGQTV